MVSLGGKVVDTIVEHPIYGEFRGMLMLMNMASVEGISAGGWPPPTPSPCPT